MTVSTRNSLRAALDEIRHSSHATAGFTTALAGAAAAALGQACVGISLQTGAGSHPVHARLGAIVTGLEDWADDDAGALATLIAFREQGREEAGWEALMAGPVAIADLACEAAELLLGFRPSVVDHVRDDMEFAVGLLNAAARSALLIVESNLRQWRASALHARYGPETERLSRRIEAIQPVAHVAWR